MYTSAITRQKNEFICFYWDNGTKYQVTDEDIRVKVKRAIVSLGLENNGIISDQVGSHSLRVGVDMALKFSGANLYDIKKMGRYSSDIFLIYIHDQISEYSNVWIKKWRKNDPISTLRKPFSRILQILETTPGKNRTVRKKYIDNSDFECSMSHGPCIARART